MKRYIVCCLLLLTVYRSYAQNLVPNPGFEKYKSCPVDNGQMPYPPIPNPVPEHVEEWFSAVYNSPDYYNGCSFGNYGVPYNFMGYHPANNGRAYTGIVMFSGLMSDPPQYNAEYIEIKLSAPLLADSFYEVSCYVKPTVLRDASSASVVGAVKTIGAAFNDSIMLSMAPPLPVNKPLQMASSSGGFLNDTTGWEKITTHYRAKGGEQWLAIGGMYNGGVPQLSRLYPDTPVAYNLYFSYYLIDDVSVTPHPPCDTIITLHDSAMCRQNALPAAIYSSGPDSSGYLWSTGDTTRRITITKGGTYWCRVIKDCNVYVDSFFIRTKIDTVKDKPYRSIQFCEGGSYELSTIATGDSYRWNTGAATRNITVTEAGSYICYIPLNECLIFSEEYQAFVNPGPGRIKDPITDTTVCEKTTLSLGLENDFPVKYQWNTGDTICCIKPAKPGLYTVTVATKDCGSISDSAYVTIKDCENCIYFPDAFTPNGDGLNDLFRAIQTCTVDQFTMRIFNRWGQEVFYTTDPLKGWNGMHGADIADVGTYFYFAEYNTVSDDKMKMLKGNVMLVR